MNKVSFARYNPATGEQSEIPLTAHHADCIIVSPPEYTAAENVVFNINEYSRADLDGFTLHLDYLDLEFEVLITGSRVYRWKQALLRWIESLPALWKRE